MGEADVGRSELFDALAPAERAALAAVLRRRDYRRGQVLFHDGDAADRMILLVRGRLAVDTVTPAGQTVAFRVVHPGEVVGELALVHAGHRRTGRVRALEDASTDELRRRDFEDLRSRLPGVDRFLVGALAERVVRTSEQVVELMQQPELRVWKRLAALAEAYGGEPIRMSQDDLAHLAGTVRQTVNRVLQAGARRNVIEVGRGSIRILDRAAVESLARGDQG